MQYTSYSVVNVHMKDFTYGKHEAAYLTKKKASYLYFQGIKHVYGQFL